MPPGLVLLEFQARIHGLNVSLGQIRMGQLLALAVTSAAIILLFLLAYPYGISRWLRPAEFRLPTQAGRYDGSECYRNCPAGGRSGLVACCRGLIANTGSRVGAARGQAVF